MLFGLELNEVIRTVGVVGIAAMIFAESGMMVGFFLPGDTLLFSAGFLVQQNVLPININLLIVILVIAAATGDNIGYMIGERWGRKLFNRPDSLFFQADNLVRAERIYNRFGHAIVIFANFFPIFRTFIPVIAGISNMSRSDFVLFNAVGVAAWVTSILYLGYFGGAFLEAHGINVEMLILPVIGTVVVITIMAPFAHMLKTAEGRGKIVKKIKKVLTLNNIL